MNFINVFSFSEPYEINELLVKLNTEDPGIDEWLITENCYTTQGEYKKHQLKSIIKEDIRFQKFLHKIIVFEMNFGPTVKYPHEDDLMEAAQRNVSKDYIDGKYSPDNTFIHVSDLDEVLDFTNFEQLTLMRNLLNDYNLIHPNLLCLAYDFDNVSIGCVWPYSKIAKLSYINENKLTFRDLKLHPVTGHITSFIGFHYYCCFPPRFILRKFQTYKHRSCDVNEINKVLYYNTGNEKVQLNEENAPVYVRENIEWLKTNSVSENYLENRKKEDVDVPDTIGNDVKEYADEKVRSE